MASGNFLFNSFNRGLLSPLALARVDLTSRTPLSAEIQTNWMPRTLGSAMLRPGLGYTGATRNNLKSKTLPFIFSNSDTARLEMTEDNMRVWEDDELVTRPEVTTAVSNGTFTTDLTDWSDNDGAGSTSQWSDGVTYGLPSGGYMELLGTGFTSASRYQLVSVVAPNAGVLHALRIVVSRGPVTLMIGTGLGTDDYVAQTTLRTGTHSIAFTPLASFYIQLSSAQTYRTFVNSVEIEGSGVMELPTPWDEEQLQYLRWDQSADIIYVAANELQQYQIERRSNQSWSVVVYQSNDGPFRAANTSQITISPSALTGDVTLTASASLFKSTQVGGLFRVTSVGQVVDTTLTGANQFGDPIRVTGTGSSRQFSGTISGTFSATITLQRSVGDDVSWVDYLSYTAIISLTNYNDGLDNQIVYYRWGIKTGNYTSGTAVTNLTYAAGGLTGIGRITSYSSGTSVGAQVLEPFGSTTGSSDWSEGSWSDYRGWPSAVALYEGRLWWAGRGVNYGSVSDAFYSFDDTVEGDSGTIQRSIGSGPVDNINWLLPVQRLMIGGEGAEYSARSNSFDEPLTPTNYNVKIPSTQGSAAVTPLKVDNYGMFIQKNNQRLFSLSYNASVDDFAPSDMTLLCPEVGEEDFVALAAQRMLDTRIHAVRGDGLTAVLVTDPLENVRAWILVETDGEIEDACVLPSSDSAEDQVYYTIKRTVDNTTVRYHEKWALESECRGETLNKQADSFVSGTQSSSATITGLDHLEGEQVVVWADGVDYSPGSGALQTLYTVTGGAISLATAVVDYVVGLPYRARYKSTKLAYAATQGTAINQMKSWGSIGFVLAYTHNRGLEFGDSFDTLKYMPLTNNNQPIPPNTVYEHFDNIMNPFGGNSSTDERVCLQATAPRPCTILSYMIGLTTTERVQKG